jgi:sialate O-acetylesterase
MIKKTDRDLWLTMVGGRVLKTAITALLVFMISGSVSAAVRLPKIFSDNMILQQEMPVPVWGWADKGEKVTVSFTPSAGSGQAYQEKTSVAGNDGRWKVTLDPMRSSKMPAELKIVGTNVITVRNILVGEVWLCSGQSNMVLTLKQVAAFDDASVADHPFIRHFGVPNKADQLRKDDLDGGAWTVCTPKSVLEFTAVGFFFGRELAKHLDVPVGLINSSWGGTPIEAWTAPEGLRQVPEIASILTQVEEWDPSTPVGGIKHAEFIAKVKEWVSKAEEALAVKSALPPIPVAPNANINQYSPTTLFNCMINPLIPFAIRGAIWYQGEANGYEGMSYLYKMKGLVGGWRQLWKQGDFPFYFVQLANFQSGDPKNVWQKLRQAQL